MNSPLTISPCPDPIRCEILRWQRLMQANSKALTLSEEAVFVARSQHTQLLQAVNAMVCNGVCLHPAFRS